MTERADAYLDTLSRMEPHIAMVNRDAALPSIAISLKRIADALEAPKAFAFQGLLKPEDIKTIKAWWEAQYAQQQSPNRPPPLNPDNSRGEHKPLPGRRFMAWLWRRPSTNGDTT